MTETDAYYVVRPNNSNRKIKIFWNKQKGAYVTGRAPPKIHALVEYLHRDDLRIGVPPPKPKPFDPNNPFSRVVDPMYRTGSIENALEFFGLVKPLQIEYGYEPIKTYPN